MGKAKDEFRVRLHMAVERLLNHVDDEEIEQLNAELSSQEYMAGLDKSLFEPTPVGRQILGACAMAQMVLEKDNAELSEESRENLAYHSNPRNRGGYQLTQHLDTDLGELMYGTIKR